MNAKRDMKVDDEWELFRGGVEQLRRVRAELTEAGLTSVLLEQRRADGLEALRKQHAEIEAAFVARNTEDAALVFKTIETLQTAQARIERQVRAASAKLPGLVASVVAGVLGRGEAAPEVVAAQELDAAFADESAKQFGGSP